MEEKQDPNAFYVSAEEFLNSFPHMRSGSKDARLGMAQVEATLAVAYEQRTANLIALYSAKDLENTLDTGTWLAVLTQIKERLGLTE